MIKKWFFKLKSWVASLARHRFAEPILFFISFAESSFFPIPPDVMLIPMVAANRKKWFRLALITTIGSVVGAIAGYMIGMFLYDAVALPLIQTYHLETQMIAVGAYFDQGAFLAMLISAFTPIPFKIFTIAGGLFRVAFLPFVIASIIGRGARFFFEAFIVHKAGGYVSLEKNPYWYMILGLLIVIAIVVYFVVK
ncbi:DedA family protein [Candidatus Nomurabacteria bacterium]|nr:DedA family protein [Candidatus Nomurabacteria bacterium]